MERPFCLSFIHNRRPSLIFQADKISRSIPDEPTMLSLPHPPIPQRVTGVGKKKKRQTPKTQTVTGKTGGWQPGTRIMESTPFSTLHVTIGDAFEFLWFLVGFWLGGRLFVGCFTVLSALLLSGRPRPRLPLFLLHRFGSFLASLKSGRFISLLFPPGHLPTLLQSHHTVAVHHPHSLHTSVGSLIRRVFRTARNHKHTTDDSSSQSTHIQRSFSAGQCRHLAAVWIPSTIASRHLHHLSNTPPCEIPNPEIPLPDIFSAIESTP